VRILDVHLAQLRDDHEAGSFDRDLLAVAIEHVQESRPVAAQRVREAVQRDPARKVRRLSGKLLESVNASADGSVLRDHARDQLDVRYAELTAAARGPLDWSGLHELRLTGKRLRYSMELFAPPLEDPALLDLYEHITEVQSRLGAINDAHELADRMEQLDLAPLAQSYRSRRDAIRDAFLAWWETGASLSIAV